jgi:hypothetical protein
MSADPVEDLACPSCGSMDLVRKVSAIYAGETATGRFRGSSTGIGALFGSNGGPIFMSTGTTLKGTSQTILSQQLAPPPMPRAKSVWGDGSIAFATILIFLFAVFGSIAVFGGDDARSPSGPLAIFFGIGLVLFFIGKRQMIRARMRAAQAALPTWERDMEQWDQQF